ncbi:stage 0 sporulation family protein [Oscillospiraceae bacterium DSM 107454]|uniref:Stage 0 sporulation family protein n=1 Tax=Ructibacterium gallinarum TaxID=2779355 RepID=A0A9D5LWG9_9FIRM|nr:stage 0 sporulation family protein [Ructibacterium gallinarum]
MVEIIGVKFNGTGKAYYFDPKGEKLDVGVQVLVETARGVEMGKVVIPNRMVEEQEIVPPLKPIIRRASEADFKQAEENKQKEKEAFEIAAAKIAEHKLEMKLVGAEYTFDRSKILFYFTADGRIDFRELVKSLASVFRTRIELRQIGVRDEARQLGSIGICGRPLCCSTFLNDFHPVSIKMAKEQGLSLNPTKISGVCGRLMCCLQYEQNAYDDMLAKMPKKGDRVETADGIGTVVDTATLKGKVKVKFTDEHGDLVKFETYALGDFRLLDKQKRGKNSKKEEFRSEEVLEELRNEGYEELTPELVAELKEVAGSELLSGEREGSGQETKKEDDGNKENKDTASKNKKRSRSRRRSGKKNRGGSKEERENRESGNGGYSSGYEIQETK